MNEVEVSPLQPTNRSFRCGPLVPGIELGRLTKERNVRPNLLYPKPEKRRVHFAEFVEIRRMSLDDPNAGTLHEDQGTTDVQRNIGTAVSVNATSGPVETCVSYGQKEFSNQTFQPDTSCDQVVLQETSRFGRYGRDIGEFRDATDVTHIHGQRILVTDYTSGHVLCCSEDGKISMILEGHEIDEPWATAVTRDGNIAVTSQRHQHVVIVSFSGDVIRSFGAGFFKKPSGVAVTQTGDFVVSDIGTNRVSFHNELGQFLCYAGKDTDNGNCELLRPRYVCTSPNGNVIVSDSRNNCLKIFDSTGNYIRTVGRYGKENGELRCPYAVATTEMSDIIVADYYNNRVSMFTSEGSFVQHLLTSSEGLVNPKGISLSPDLTLRVTQGNHRAVEVRSFQICRSSSCEYFAMHIRHM